MIKLRQLLLFLLLFIVTCSFQGDYLPVKSEFYKIEKKSIFFENSDLTITVSGKCSRPDLYNLTSKFNIAIQTKSDSLNIDFNDINLVADNSKFFNKYFITGPNGESKLHYNLLSNHEYTFSIQGILFDSLLIEFDDNLEEVNLTMNGISNTGNLVNIPVFLFKTDSTIFNIKK